MQKRSRKIRLLAAGALLCAPLFSALLTGCGGGSTSNPPVAQSRIVFASDRAEPGSGQANIYSMKPDGSDVQRVTTTNTTLPNGAPSQDIEPAYSPDRSKITFVSNRTGKSEIYLMEATAGGVPVRLTSSPEGQRASLPTFSPDGRQIAFDRFETGTINDLGIYVMDANGGNVRRLTTAGSSPSWSRNNKIAFDAFKPAALQSSAPIAEVLKSGPSSTKTRQPRSALPYPNTARYIWIINPDGSGLTQVTHKGGEHEPTFSPDGNRIAYVPSFGYGDSSSSGLFTIKADGSGESHLTVGGPSPVFSPDGQKLAFVGGNDIFTANADGSGRINLTNSTAIDTDPDWR